MLDDLNPIENDAILEVFNIAMGMAGTTLSQMVNDEVTLQVPSIKFFTINNTFAKTNDELKK